jgi:MFS family permease
VWAAVPILNGVLFATAPIYPLNPEGGAGLTLKELCRNKVFWLLMLMMLGAGAAENTVSQWASAFAEEGLGVTKTVGDLAGPMAFAALMGTARLIYGKWGHKLHLEKCMLGSSLLCVAAYLAIALVPDPRLALVGCAVCGFAVGILWPGTFSKGAAAIPKGGTAMFALFALAGDLGCSAGPTLAGMVTRVCDGNMRRGILAGIVFPLLLVLCLVFGKKRKAAAGNAQADTNRSHG